MVNFKKLLSPSAEQLVNYNYTDIAAGTGYVTYYAGIVSNAILCEKTFYSNDIIENVVIASSAYIAQIDKDFDITFNKPATLKGNAIVEIPLGFGGGIDNTENCYVYVDVKVRKWDGTTETEIASGQTPVWSVSVGGTGVVKYNMKTALVTIPQTHYKRGETLRLSTIYYTKKDIGTPVNVHSLIIAHDPMDRKESINETYSYAINAPTILKVQIPFKLDL